MAQSPWLWMAVADTDAALAIIPAGTGNDGARHFGITDWRRSGDQLLNNLKAGHLNTVKTDLIKLPSQPMTVGNAGC